MTAKTRFSVVAVCVGLLTATLGAQLAEAGEGQAEAAKSSKKANKKKAKKFLQGSLWTNIRTNNVTGGSITTYVGFCQSGRYGFQKDDDNPFGASQTTYQGNWNVKSAGRTSARIGYTVENFRSVYFDGSPGPDAPPASPGEQSVSAGGQNQMFTLGLEFTRGQAISC